MEIVRYNPSFKGVWDGFVDASKNGTFLFRRDYMEYHSDRFTDASLLFLEEGKLRAVFPASLHGSRIVSHGGLTFGGFVTDLSMTAQTMLRMMEALVSYWKGEGLSELLYKRVPAIYHSYPSDEDLYALFRIGAVLAERGLSSTVCLPERIKYSERRNRSIKKAIHAGIVFKESKDYGSYMGLLSEVLMSRHGIKPAHSAEEISLLASRFPDNIKLFVASKDGRLLAGTVVYETSLVAHTQYLANSEEGRNCGALDFVIDRLITDVYASKRFFDFGISTEDGGHFLNEGLVGQKQEFGGRGVVYDKYLINL